MKLKENLHEYLKKAQTPEAINVAIGLVVVEALDAVIRRLDNLALSWGAPTSVDVVGHPGISQQVSTTSPIKADKVRKSSKKV